ncbi:MAG: ABC transporter permease [Bacteroidetes bacterium]|nr:ABC transporter permease [Bacteroidota bacterium]
MFRSFFKTTFRNLARNRVYSFINIAGLSMGLACAMLIMLYVKDEVSFDRFHKNVNNIYRIVSKSKQQGQEKEMGNTGFLQGPRFTQNISGIISFVRIQNGVEDIKTGTEVESQSLLYVDSTFFSIFTFPLSGGNYKSCLTEPHSIVLSEDAAKRYFATTDVVGKVMMIKEDSNFVPYKVTAVAKRCPQNSSIQFDMLLPFRESNEDAKNTANWFFGNFLNTFVVLNDKANLQTVENQMQAFYIKDAKQTYEALAKKFGFGADAKMGTTYFLQPYSDMHLSTDLPANDASASNPVYSYLLSGIALFVLLIACINFVNLSAARSARRAKEVGIRKVIGGNRKQLIMQFLGESFFLCTIAFVLAIVLVGVLLPLFNNLSSKALSLSYLSDAKLIAGYIMLYLITALLAGIYPALVLSGYNPVHTLSNRFKIAGKNYLQKSLVVLQFALSSFLIMATFIIYSQFNFLTKTKLGYDDKNLVVVNKERMKHADAAVFKNELLKNPKIVGITAKNAGYDQAAARNAIDSIIQFAYETVDENYLALLKVPLVAGRNFSTAFPSDSSQSVIVNESFVKAANWNHPIGETLKFSFDNNKIYRVIGVVKDYHFASLNEKIRPQLFTMKNDNLYGTFYIKLNPRSVTESLKWIQKTFTQFYPLSPYSYTFKNDDNRKQYSEVEKWKQIILFGAILTIFISCIGLFGLSVLSVEKRTKEIGIRKVFGASVKSIVTNLSTDFIKLVIIALVIASPLAYMIANKWLQKFPYRITISWPLFASAALLVMLIALITVSFQSIKAAVANPIKSLRMD